MSINAVRLNHAVLFVADLEHSVSFYQDAFAMSVIAREPRATAAFLRLPRSGNHHDLGLFGVGAQPPRPRGGLGLYHLAWQVDTIEELSRRRASRWSTSTPSPASPVTVRPRASTGATRTATSSR
jgi:catechol 2,3-dioxygenase-like lactoylglutathione lyase family enzyme